jgi:hypothetical protein
VTGDATSGASSKTARGYVVPPMIFVWLINGSAKMRHLRGAIRGSIAASGHSRTGPLDVNFHASSGQLVLTAVLLMSRFRMLQAGTRTKRHNAPLRIAVGF